jgi:sugar phosphate isomerase/epimerase
MRISTSNRLLFQTYGWEKALEMLASAGFDCVDMTFTTMAKDPEDAYLQPDAPDLCRRIRAKAESLGLTFNQSHAPYSMDMKPWLEGDRDHILHLVNTAIELSGILGVKNVVVHPVQCMNYLNSDPEWVKQVNVEFYSTLIPAAQEAGVKIAIENMWQRHLWSKAIVSSVCSSPYELRDYVDACNVVAPVFTACLDIGHCLLTGHDPVNAIHVLGDRLGCLHVHDVDGVNDNHTCPMTMKVDFPAVVAALREIGYKGDFTLEADCYYKCFPQEQYPVALQNLANACALLVK